MRQLVLIGVVAASFAFPGQGNAQQAPLRSPLTLGHTLPIRVSWTRTDIALASGFAAALLMDAGQTRGLARGGWEGFHETNPLLGRTPSVGRINVYTAVAGLTVLGAAAALPARLRPWFLGAAFVVEAFTVGRNAQGGIPIRLP